MRRVDWTPSARQDLAGIDEYWSALDDERADTILERIAAAGTFLCGTPHAGPTLDHASVRKWSVRRTTYLLLYRIHSDRIEVIRVHHMSEDWQDAP